ncbi:endolytic transglycosylase MltG [Parabacteroides sp. 52]|uniref:endolytic transglycosylase MltG n=1 Tax=unclassified Parabacteroides TaxID=2649774 RepID=UPI0013D76EB3|nr:MULTISPECIES: endolytic transglycosylase MltG [unclassified Parabacteroides]MDH6533385.1 UPF0755 protein [Parabacteroides sp. PM5-20]NDV54143.1 endolytic transglycosylase MltG [Parabacteroides sp. 52]
MEKWDRVKRIIKWSVLLLVCAFLIGIGCWGYRQVMGPNFMSEETVYIYVDRQTDFDALCLQLQDSVTVEHIETFEILAEILEYPDLMRTGRYAVTPHMSNMELLNKLRRGQQTATRITFHNIRFLEDLTKRLEEQLMLSASDLLSRLEDPAYCDSLGFNTETIKSMFLPNTYEVYWNISADGFLNRMKKEYDNFWTEQRRKKAEAIGLTPVEVSILASIVEEETAVADEYPVVAGLYINRLQRGMLLQADPTVKYAVGDVTLQRILFVHLEVDSPYNTYIHPGLPPGPLRIPSIKGLESVLNYTKHHYLYMVAKEDFSGRHNFATTLTEHNRNANRYRSELNRRKIR